MEWMLQLADELDDMAGVMRHLWIGLRSDIAIRWRTVVFPTRTPVIPRNP